jgi:hypothetical protein
MTYHPKPFRSAAQTKSLQAFIQQLWTIPAENFAMTNLRTVGHNCGSICCIEGWRQVVFDEPLEDHERVTFHIYDTVEQQFGIPHRRWHSIMHCGTGEDNYSFDSFDSLPPEQRKLCMIDVLEQELRTGTHSWDVAVVGVCGPELAAKLKGMTYEDTGEPAEDQEVRSLWEVVRSDSAPDAAVQRLVQDRAVSAQEAKVLLEEVC